MEETQETKSKSPVIFVVVGVLVIAALGVFAVMNMQKSKQDAASTAAPSESQNTVTVTQAPVSGEEVKASNVKTFNVEGGMYYFTPKEIRVKQGDTVKIHFTNKGGMHDWVLDEFNAKTPVINSDETADVEFVANKKGTFEYYCSVGDHRAMGMVGNLVVE